jgi:hypothetical protein
MSDDGDSLTKKFNSKVLAGLLAIPAAAAGFALGKFGVGPLEFTNPLVMAAGMGALPPIWEMLKSVPPKPWEVFFPAIRLLFNLHSEDQSPARMPLWQRALGVSIPFFLTLGLAQPHLHPDKALAGKGPILTVVNNGWGSGPNWTERVDGMKRAIDRAEREHRPILLLPTAQPADGSPLKLLEPVSAAEARRMMQDIKPEPWPSDYKAALDQVKSLSFKEPASVVWLSDDQNGPGALELAQQLKSIGRLTVFRDDESEDAHLLVPPDATADTLTVSVKRPSAAKPDVVILAASDEFGKVLAQTQVDFKEGEKEAKGTFKVPAEVQNQITGVSILGENSAGAKIMLDERWRRRPVGVVNDGAGNSYSSLLNQSTYVEKALGSYVDMRQGSVDDLLKRKMAVMIMTDDVGLSESSHKKISDWVNDGGTLLRFAGPNLAAQAKPDDDLLPVQLRPGAHEISNQMAGTGPGKLDKFDPSSPFANVKISPDITIDKDVLAQVAPDLDQKTWARLKDGTPLVTAAQHGKGWVVLVHTTAGTDWSNLALSDTFIDMMRAVVSHSQGVSPTGEGTGAALPPLKVMDGRGQFVTPDMAAQPLTEDVIASGKVGPANPPGFYGNESVRQAHNLAGGVPVLEALPNMPNDVASASYNDKKGENDLTGPMLAGALTLLLIDLAVILGQRGLLPRQGGNEPNFRPTAAASAPPPKP